MPEERIEELLEQRDFKQLKICILWISQRSWKS